MTLQELRYLVALADSGHFGRAAEACHISQPTLSTQLKKLETFLGITLFERTNKALKITPLGEKIVARARQVLAEADAIVALAQENTGPLSGPFHLGVIPTLSPYLLPWLLPALKKSHPDLKLALHEDLTQALIDRLKSHRLDAALLSLPVKDDELVSEPLFDEPFFFACSGEHKLSHAESVDTADLAGAHLLLLTDGHCLRDQALTVCGMKEAQEEETDFRASSLETIRQMVASGMGCTLLPALAAAPGKDRLEIRPLRGEASRRIGIVWRKSYPKAADIERFANIVRAHLPAAVRLAAT